MAEIKIIIKTPVGYAKSTQFKLKPFLIGNKGKLNHIMTNDDDSKILWIVDANARQYTKIIRNVTAYKVMIKGILNNKTVRKVAKLNKDQEQELNNMLTEQTEIDIVQMKDWDKIKKEFKEI